MGATFWSSPSGDLSCHFDPSSLGRGLHHHDEVPGHWCRNNSGRLNKLRDTHLVQLFFGDFLANAIVFTAEIKQEREQGAFSLVAHLLRLTSFYFSRLNKQYKGFPRLEIECPSKTNSHRLLTYFSIKLVVCDK